eukprot:CAMPEP_0119119660 /NCGR_PEP_ID=MMETSP1310-20130426/1056_1 /TAXON_ID=464262 /ORGANISM="Genus nov. species nov., Strain RCC2339" /LENGTH=183 /DNA_ID=CAMNT_0007109105 /DNA_START=98 /DNA_END=649 /DNA_ORIENTATION=-
MGSDDSKKKKRKKSVSDDGQPMKKRKKNESDTASVESSSSKEGADLSKTEDWEAQRAFACAIASPMLDEKYTKRVLRVIAEGAKEKNVRRGIREVVKYVRRGEKGICILAGNISPIDVLSHVPILCEKNDIAYCYIPSKESLGAACISKRPTSAVLLKPGDGYKKEYQKLEKKMQSLERPVNA